MDRTLDSVGNGYRLCILKDLNRWIGDRTRAGITGVFGVLAENEFCISTQEWQRIRTELR